MIIQQKGAGANCESLPTFHPYGIGRWPNEATLTRPVRDATLVEYSRAMKMRPVRDAILVAALKANRKRPVRDATSVEAFKANEKRPVRDAT